MKLLLLTLTIALCSGCQTVGRAMQVGGQGIQQGAPRTQYCTTYSQYGNTSYQSCR